jgi:hypothetical protein
MTEPLTQRSLLSAVLAFVAPAALVGVALVVAAVLGSTSKVRHAVDDAQARDAIAEVLAAHEGPPRAELQQVERRWRAVPRADAGIVLGGRPHEVGALLWDPTSARLVSVTVPVWAVTATNWKMHALGDTVAPLERRLGVALEVPGALLDAPGLLIDHVFPDGRRLLVWCE